MDAVGGLNPPETLEERMRAMTVICRLSDQHRSVTSGGSTHAAWGNIIMIGRRDFNLTKYQVRLCLARARERLGKP